MIAKIGEKEYCLDGYTNIYILPELLEKVYQQGKNDGVKEICKKADDYCNNCYGECFDCQLSIIDNFAEEIKEQINE